MIPGGRCNQHRLGRRSRMLDELMDRGDDRVATVLSLPLTVFSLGSLTNG